MFRITMNDPVALFETWFKEAEQSGEKMPDAVALASVSKEAKPSVRIMLFKGIEDGAFSFYTNYNSAKCQDLDHNPYAALAFYWVEKPRQVRIEGKVEKASEESSDKYWKTRPRSSQIGAWTSPQSQRIQGRKQLEVNLKEFEKKFEGIDVPRPKHWGGYRLIPDRIEFWTGREHRLHDRELYIRHGNDWELMKLAP